MRSRVIYFKPVRLVELANFAQIWTGWQQAKRLPPAFDFVDSIVSSAIFPNQNIGSILMNAKEIRNITVYKNQLPYTISDLAFSFCIFYYNGATGISYTSYSFQETIVAPNAVTALVVGTWQSSATVSQFSFEITSTSNSISFSRYLEGANYNNLAIHLAMIVY